MNCKRILVCAILCLTHTGYPAVGCMDNSHYLQTTYDTKELHYISCNCNCDSATMLRTWGKCILCEHYHQPKNWIVTQKGNQVATVLQYRSTSRYDELSLSPATQNLIHTLVSRYKKNR
jgi:hypothetical protein